MANTTFRHIFLKAAEAFCWFIGTVAGMFALVLALTLFASTSSTQSSPSSAPTASSTFHHGTCDEDELHRLIPTYVSYVVCAMAITTLLMVFVRKVAGGVAKDHERVAAWEDAAYKAAYDAAEVANEVVERAEKVVKELNDPRRVNLALGVPEHDQALDAARKKLEECVQEYRRATDKAERLEPKEGIARLPKRWRSVARSAFFSAVCAHYMGSGSAGFAFYCSLETQTECTTSFLTIFMFVLAGVVSTTIHDLLLWVSSTQN